MTSFWVNEYPKRHLKPIRAKGAVLPVYSGDIGSNRYNRIEWHWKNKIPQMLIMNIESIAWKERYVNNSIIGSHVSIQLQFF